MPFAPLRREAERMTKSLAHDREIVATALIDPLAQRLHQPPSEEGDEAAAHAATKGVISLAAPEVADVIRDRVVRAAMLGLHHAAEIHYTQDARRWDGIRYGRRVQLGDFPRWADCSSFVTWCWWDALGGPSAGPDILNGQAWQAGYTGTLMAHGTRVSLTEALPGDLVFYGPRPGNHVPVGVARDRVVSPGSEGGPSLLSPGYRRDLSEVRRYFGQPGGGGGVQLVVDGVFGPATIRALQRALGVAVDGQFGPVTQKALQSRLGVAADGVIGPITIRALQRRVGATVDGQWGPETTKALQRALNAGTF